MDFYSDLDFPNLDNAYGFNWFYPVEQPEKMMEISPLDAFLSDLDLVPLPYQSKQLCFNEFPDLENFSCDFAALGYTLPPLYEDFVIDQKPVSIIMPTPAQCESLPNGFAAEASSMIIGSGLGTFVKEEEVNKETTSIRKKRSASLEFDEIRNHFDVPITKAAKEMNVGLTLLKRRCRELNITRWPHRKIKSLKSLIDNVKELGLTNEVAMLEKHKWLVEKLPDMELNEQTKKLRQACFKANYKRRRSLALQS